MGSWGSGTFENDHVMDWLVKLEQLKPADDVLPILGEALTWVIEHQNDAPGYKSYGKFSELDTDPTLVTALMLLSCKSAGWTIQNKEKPEAYLSWDRRFDIGAAAAEIVAILAGYPMEALLVVDELSGGHADISKVTNGRSKPPLEIVKLALRAVDIVLIRNELYDRWVDKKTAREWLKLTRNLRHRLTKAPI